MTRLHLVRHGKAAAGYGQDPDPGLDDEGHHQAAAAAEALRDRGPLPVLVSPLRRTLETAWPFERQWDAAALVEPRVGEIPSPTADLTHRSRWLREVLRGSWHELSASARAWRQELIELLVGIDTETVVVTHFVAINVVIGQARGDSAVVQELVTNGSRTVVELVESSLRVVEVGATADGAASAAL